MARILGIDYGAQRVGVALSDDGRSVAFPKTIFKNDGRLLDALAELVEMEQVDHVVLGESDNPAGGMNTIVRRIRLFRAALEVRLGLPIELVSEAYSSAEARRAPEGGEAKLGAPVDASAAAIILQSYLDRTRSTAARGTQAAHAHV